MWVCSLHIAFKALLWICVEIYLQEAVIQSITPRHRHLHHHYPIIKPLHSFSSHLQIQLTLPLPNLKNHSFPLFSPVSLCFYYSTSSSSSSSWSSPSSPSSLYNKTHSFILLPSSNPTHIHYQTSKTHSFPLFPLFCPFFFFLTDKAKNGGSDPMCVQSYSPVQEWKRRSHRFVAERVTFLLLHETSRRLGTASALCFCSVFRLWLLLCFFTFLKALCFCNIPSHGVFWGSVPTPSFDPSSSFNWESNVMDHYGW